MQSIGLSKLLILSALAVLANSASAGANWNLANTSGSNLCTQNAANANTYGNSWACSGGADASTPAATVTSATATAWANTNAGTFDVARLAQYSGSGFGVVNKVTGETTSPQHSMDNSGSTDLMSFKFGASVALSSIQLGWVSGDRDISVLAYTGPTPIPSDISGKTVLNLINNGWTLVSQSLLAAAGQQTTTTTYNFNTPNAISSSWWLISAYNSGYDGVAGGSVDGYSDYVKVLKVAGTVTPPPPGVPEPGSMALLGIGMLGMLYSRRRKVA